MKYIWNINVIQSFQGGYGEIYAYDYYGGSPELFPRGEIFIVIILITEEKYCHLSIILMKYASSLPFSNIYPCLADGEQKRKKRRVQ